MSEINYVYPVEELDKMIEQINQGITPIMTDQMITEIQLRVKELQDEITEDDMEDDPDYVVHQKMMAKIEAKKHASNKKDIVLLKISDEQKAKIREEMETSIVRDNPNIPYHISDDELYSSEERKAWETKLSRIKSCYYNQPDYVAAITTIREAIMYSLENDYPWLSKEEALKQFNEGKIRYSFNGLPKLYLNYTTQVTDPELLKGIITGEVKLVDKNERIAKKRIKSNPIHYDYNVIQGDAYQYYVAMHKAGYDTPISTILNRKNTMYDRFALPASNRFAAFNTTSKPTVGVSMEFDWTQPYAGEKYFNLVNNKKTTASDIARAVNEMNGGMLKTVIGETLTTFQQSLRYANRHQQEVQSMYEVPKAIEKKPETVALESAIIDAIRTSNPNK